MDTYYIVYCNECDEIVDRKEYAETAAAAVVGHGLRDGCQDIVVRTNTDAS